MGSEEAICTAMGGFERCEVRTIVEVNNSDKSVSFPLKINIQ